jgi:hypothetical protein
LIFYGKIIILKFYIEIDKNIINESIKSINSNNYWENYEIEIKLEF